MAWTAPATVAAGQLMTASFWNTHVRDNELYLFGADKLTLLKAGSGTSTAAGATTVDSVATGALTGLDTIVVEATATSTTQATARPQLYNVTDSNIISDWNFGGANIPAGQFIHKTAKVRNRPNVTSGIAYVIGIDSGTGLVTGEWNGFTLAGGWTTGFTIGFRHNGVTAGGTFAWSWAVYLLKGQ